MPNFLTQACFAVANPSMRENKLKRYPHFLEKIQQFLKMLMLLWVLNALKKRGYHVLVDIKIKQSLKTKDNSPFFSRCCPLHIMKTALNYALFYKEQLFTVVSCSSEVQTKERKLRFWNLDMMHVWSMSCSNAWKIIDFLKPVSEINENVIFSFWLTLQLPISNAIQATKLRSAKDTVIWSNKRSKVIGPSS